MNILFLDAYFEPEQIAFTHLEHDLLEKLVDEGNNIQIICPTPTRGIPKKIANKYKNCTNETLFNGHVHVTRFIAPQEGNNPVIRALRYFWCNIRTYQIGNNVKAVDVVFCNSTPPTQGWIAGKIAKNANAPLIYSLQDIFPDSLITSGLSKKNSILWKIGRKLEDDTYKGCCKIITITDAMKKNLLEKGVESEKIEVISNWIDIDKIIPVSREENKLFDEFEICRSKFIVLYAGNFGEAQGAEIVLKVAEQLQYDEGFFFVVFGGGPGYDNAVKKTRNLKNVFIHPLMSQDRISEVYSMGDVALITCKKGVGKSGMPSKLWSILACNTPVIASFDTDSELAYVIEESKSGICVEPENERLLIDAIKELKNSNNQYKQGREFVKRTASKGVCLKRYCQIIQNAKGIEI